MFLEWQSETLVACPGYRLPVREVYARYREYCKLRGVKVAGRDHHLGRQLKGERKFYVRRVNGRNRGAWYLLGFAFKDDNVEPGKVDTFGSLTEFLTRMSCEATKWTG